MDATANFERTLAAHEVGPLVRGPATTLQVNVGKRCNQACHHCHVEAGPPRVEVVASLPCYGPENVDRQRGHGAFDKSIAALRRLNALGYGTEQRLDLVYNPVGAFLPPPQAELETRYREELRGRFGLEFHRLL